MLRERRRVKARKPRPIELDDLDGEGEIGRVLRGGGKHEYEQDQGEQKLTHVPE
jgi:hypothetical protein